MSTCGREASPATREARAGPGPVPPAGDLKRRPWCRAAITWVAVFSVAFNGTVSPWPGPPTAHGLRLSLAEAVWVRAVCTLLAFVALVRRGRLARGLGRLRLRRLVSVSCARSPLCQDGLRDRSGRPGGSTFQLARGAERRLNRACPLNGGDRAGGAVR